MTLRYVPNPLGEKDSASEDLPIFFHIQWRYSQLSMRRRYFRGKMITFALRCTSSVNPTDILILERKKKHDYDSVSVIPYSN